LNTWCDGSGAVPETEAEMDSEWRHEGVHRQHDIITA